jgi:RecA-family ATPase
MDATQQVGSTALRLQLVRAGFTPLPLFGKAPPIFGKNNQRKGLSGWEKLDGVTQEQIAMWSRTWPDAANTGILCRQTPTLDLDILYEPAARAVEDFVREQYEEAGYILVRTGKAPKRAIPFRTQEPFTKIVANVIAPNGTAEKIEFLGDGQQVACFGTHPDTQQPYHWHGGQPGEITRDDLPYIREQEAQTLVDNIVELLVRDFKYTRAPVRPKTQENHGANTGGKSGSADWQYLFDNIREGRELHDSLRDLGAKLIKTGMRPGAVVNQLRALMNGSATPHDDRWQDRYDDIPRLVEGAEQFQQENVQQPTTPPLPFINISNWDNEPVPEQEWAVFARVPTRHVTLFSGEGAAGKSTEQLHLCTAHALARDWLGTMPEAGPAIFIDAEDDKSVLHRRAAAILGHYQTTFKDAVRGGLHLVSLTGHDPVLAAASRSGRIEATSRYKQLLEAAGDIRPKMIGIASSANVFAGSEIDRSQVQQFIDLLTAVAQRADGALVLISHPSLTGISTDTGLSGNTQWHNAVRARFYMKGIRPEAGEQADSDLREIVFKKNNYGPISESILLRYHAGLFLPLPGVGSLDRVAKEVKAVEVFLDLLRRFEKENRHVSSNASRSYAPALFAREDEAKRGGLTSKHLEAAMRLLFKEGKVWNEPCGKPSRPAFRLALKP